MDLQYVKPSSINIIPQGCWWVFIILAFVSQKKIIYFISATLSDLLVFPRQIIRTFFFFFLSEFRSNSCCLSNANVRKYVDNLLMFGGAANYFTTAVFPVITKFN